MYSCTQDLWSCKYKYWSLLTSSKWMQKEQIFTSRPKNLPIDANKCRILLLLKLIKTSAAVMLPWFKASSHSINTEGSRIFRDDWRRKRPFLQDIKTKIFYRKWWNCVLKHHKVQLGRAYYAHICFFLFPYETDKYFKRNPENIFNVFSSVMPNWIICNWYQYRKT